MFKIGRIRSPKMNDASPPNLMPPRPSTPASGILPTEQVNEANAPNRFERPTAHAKTGTFAVSRAKMNFAVLVRLMLERDAAHTAWIISKSFVNRQVRRSPVMNARRRQARR
ncbi:hypothetical protein [Paraburkholderia sp. HD33-4]|uniref:hypothetical protein n=1 Tax=Paraburkholderia sp. HD33-4 TaxID=2883242 RepID=UPI001F35278D|nr:hypothetical protein [Paraburkholderia sp. HD33-4]